MLIQLRDIKSCPECGCKRVTEERKHNLHTNSHWNESIKFDCGYNATFSPNFMKISVSNPCERSDEYTKKMDRRDVFKIKLGQFIEGGKIDDEYKERLKRQFEHL